MDTMRYAAVIAHHVPGRLRLNLAGARRHREALERAKAAIAAIETVRRVETNPLTGSVLVWYEGAPDQVLQQVWRAGDAGGCRAANCCEAAPAFVRKSARIPKIAAAYRQKAQWRKLAGRSLLAAGVAGVLLPVVPGMPFLIAGAAVLASDDPLVTRGADLIRYARTALTRFREM